MYAVSLTLHKYGILVIAALGTVGNALSLLVFSRPYFSGATPSIFLRFLAAFDTLTLWSYVVWDATYYFRPEATSETFCQALFWVMAAAPHVASYILLAVTVERLVAVVRPLYARVAFTRRRVLGVSMCVATVPFVYNAAYFRLATVHPAPPRVCRLRPDLKRLADTWHYFDAIVGIIVPALLILVLNVGTILAFRRASRRRRHLSFKLEGAADREKGQHLTRMLMGVSLAYWVLMLPNAGFFIAKIYWRFWESAWAAALYHLLYRLSYLLMISTNAVQFVLYMLTATKFAEELRDMLMCVSSPA